MDVTLYLIGVPIALLVVTILKAREFGFVTVGGFAENIFIAAFWPFALFSVALAAILTCDFCIWGRE